jgi:hypothetical protein
MTSIARPPMVSPGAPAHCQSVPLVTGSEAASSRPGTRPPVGGSRHQAFKEVARARSRITKGRDT